MKETSARNFTEVKYQKKVLNVFLSVILINSVFRTCKNYYPQVFLEECKYVVKEIRMPKYITDDVQISSDEEISDKESSDKENYSEG